MNSEDTRAPRVEAEPSVQSTEKSRSGPIPLRPLRVCLLADSFHVTRAVSNIVEEAGHKVDHFAVPDEALGALFERDYDLLVVSQFATADDLDCTEILRTLRLAPDARRQNMGRVVLTDDDSPSNLRALTFAGATQIIMHDSLDLRAELLEALQIEALPPGALDQAAGPGRRSAKVSMASPYGAEDIALAPRRKVSAKGGVGTAQGAGQPRVPRVEALPARPRNWTRNVVAAVAVVAVAVGLGGLYYVTDRVPVEAVKAQVGTLSTAVGAAGRVVSRKTVAITSPVAGQIRSVQAREGEAVKKGGTLATLDDREAQVNVKRAEAKVALAGEELAFAERSVKQLEERERELAERAGDAGRASAADGGRLLFPGAAMIGPAAGRDESPASIAQQLKQARSDVIAARSKKRLAEEDLRAARLERDRLKITAPFSGVIVRAHAVEGLWAGPSTPLFTLVDTGETELALNVAADDANAVLVGQAVRLSSPAFPAVEWHERLVRVEQRPGEGLVAYAAVGAEAPPLKFGQGVEAQILTQTSPNAVKVPVEAVTDRDGRDVVAVVNDGRVHFRAVNLGIHALTEVEVLNGVEPGEVVVLPRLHLTEGQRVEATVLPQFASTEGFPLREEYADVAIYTTEQLRRNYSDVHVVDVRSRFEYDIVHAADAVNIPIASADFLDRVGQLRDKTGTKPIVFYCNGHTCAKSYKASRKAAENGFKHVYAYDSGIFDWMKANRYKTTLLKNTPAPVSKMVSEDYFQSRLVDFAVFKKKARDSDAVVVDIRDEMQRKTTMALASTARPLDAFIKDLEAGRYKGKQLLIFDAVGKQVRWLQYILEDLGYKNYFFLKGGIKNV